MDMHMTDDMTDDISGTKEKTAPILGYRDFVFMGFVALFFAEVYTISLHIQMLTIAPWYFWALYPFAVLMSARSIVHYYVFDWLRKPFVHLEKDSCGAGADNHPNEGRIKPFGELISCPVCTGLHAGSALLALYTLAPAFGLSMIVVLGIGGINPLLYYANELLSWGSRFARVCCGRVSPDKE